MAFQLPSFPLIRRVEPHIDARTMEYTLQTHADSRIGQRSVEGAPPRRNPLKTRATSDNPGSKRRRDHNGGGMPINLFWQVMGKGKGGEPKSNIAKALTSEFGDFAKFKDTFSDVAANRFGSGWAWLVVNGKGKLQVLSTANQDSPYMAGHVPILGLDVWEHAYYLNYQNRRPDYIAAWWNVVNWDKVAELYDAAKG